MAKTEAVWGIDIGNCSLKALRCVRGSEPGQIVASAFDYIEYPKILTQPGADQAELVSEALAQFLSRNTLRGDRVAISVPGQNGLARFIKLPPVEAKKIPDVVKYEVRQQIPFDLNDVIWDYQRMGGAIEEDGFALEAEVGLFAMKKDQVYQTLEPYNQTAPPIEVDFIQLAPLVLFNLMVYDQLTDLPSSEDYDPEDPPPSVVVLSIGTDSSDLIVTDGFRTWQRSLLVGGNHFTKALTKELKLTFASAEHLKRNAQQAPDPKAVFQAMRPVFQNLVDEIHRSLSYFGGLNRTAKIERILLAGNTTKLPGLQRFLTQNLGMEVELLETYRRLYGPEITESPIFRNNLSCFSLAYGLAIQGLGESQIRTNFIPRDIVKDRLIRTKKPWAVAATSLVLLSSAVSLAGWKMTLGSVADTKYDPSLREADSAVKEVENYRSEATKIEGEMKSTEEVGGNLVKNIEGRTAWMELMTALTQAMPYDKVPVPDLSLRNEITIASIRSQMFTSKEDVTAWLTANAKWIHQTEAAAKAVSGDTSATSSTSPETSGISRSNSAGAAGEGVPTAPETDDPIYLITLNGFHYHNQLRPVAGEVSGQEYLRRNLLDVLSEGKALLPTGDPSMPYEDVEYKDIQILYPALISPEMEKDRWIPNPKIQAVMDQLGLPFNASGNSGGMGGGPGSSYGTGGDFMGGMSGGPGMMPGGMPGLGGRMPGLGGGMPGLGGSRSGMTGMNAQEAGPPTAKLLLSQYFKEGELPEGIYETDELQVQVRQFDFEVQFLWIPLSRNERQKKAAEAAGTSASDGMAVVDELVDDELVDTTATGGAGTAGTTVATPDATGP